MSEIPQPLQEEVIRAHVHLLNETFGFTEEHHANPETILEDTQKATLLVVRLRAAMENLTDREKEVINRRFGLQGEGSQKLAQIAPSIEKLSGGIGVHKERVRQIEARALAKLRRKPISAPLREFLPEDLI